MQRRGTFESAAERYDRARPPYPRQVFEDLAALAQLEGGSRVLEIGSGTGLATVPLGDRGYRIIAVELGAELAAIARRRLAGYANVEIVVAPFEDWPLPSEPFDAVVSATAFHWIDPEIRVRKSAQALRAGGSLAIIETRRVPLGDAQLLADVWRCSERFDPTARPPRNLTANEPPEALAEIQGSGLFDHVASRRYDWTQEYTSDGYIDLLMTFSNVLALESRAQSGLLECMADVIDGKLGGHIGEHLVNHLVVARTPSRLKEALA